MCPNRRTKARETYHPSSWIVFAGFSPMVGRQAGGILYKSLIFNGLKFYVKIYKPLQINKLPRCAHTIDFESLVNVAKPINYKSHERSYRHRTHPGHHLFFPLQ